VHAQFTLAIPEVFSIGTDGTVAWLDGYRTNDMDEVFEVDTTKTLEWTEARAELTFSVVCKRALNIPENKPDNKVANARMMFQDLTDLIVTSTSLANKNLMYVSLTP